MQFFIYACTVYADTGERYWPDFESFKNDQDSPVIGPASKEFLSIITGLDKDYEKKLPENAWLIRMGFMNDDMRLINSDGKLVDFDGRLINEDGRWINEDGAFVDSEGSLIDENGMLIIEDGWEDSKESEE